MFSLVNVASAAPAANIPAPTNTMTTSPIRIASVSGATTGYVVIDTQTGWFVCYAQGGLQPGTTYYLQYHVTGLAGAGVLGSGVANQQGIVVIWGKLDASQLALVKNPGDFSIGPFVL